MPTRKTLLVILDGFGCRKARDGNAILLAGTPALDGLCNEFPHGELLTSGLAVGLPDGQMGNSEVGHTNIGAGRIVFQDLVRINRACESGELARRPAIAHAFDTAKSSGGALHLFGLVSDGGVHSSLVHLSALLRAANERGLSRVFVHAFTDGRDTSPKSGAGFLAALEREMAGTNAQVATVTGRYFAMDRDHRWDRVERAYNTLVRGEGHLASSGEAAVQAAYARGETDEFIAPTVIVRPDGTPRGLVRDGDVVLFFNFRSDRARELTRAFTEPSFTGFTPTPRPRLATYVTMTEYDKNFGLRAAFPPEQPSEILPELVSRAGLRQMRCAETEKYAHVTFFFNGGREVVFPSEERILVPSPRDVATYDLKPEMSAREVTAKLCAKLPEVDFAVVNYANPDMVGHTGVLSAAITAVKVVDECVGVLVKAAQDAGFSTIITADHGNCEMMIDPVTGGPHTQHTIGPVPVIVVDRERRGTRVREGGILADVAPTLCAMIGLPQPNVMTGRPLLHGE